MTTKAGRNQPCPCGSGKKYKQCCLRAEKDAEHAAMAADHDEDVARVDASNAMMKLLRDGKLDEAEQAARDLLGRFPYSIVAWNGLGMVYEARGDAKQAAQYYRRALEFIRYHAEQFGSDNSKAESVLIEHIAQLDPPAT